VNGPDRDLVLALVVLVVGTVGLSFLVGALSPATWIARAFGKDVSHSGSGNPGATNAGRVLGVKWGVLVGVLDVLKGFVPCWLALRAGGPALAALAAVAVVLGHMFSPFLRGRGGKGVATTLGALLAVTPWVALVALVAFAVFVGMTRRVGEASVGTCVVLVLAGALALAGVIDRVGGLRLVDPPWLGLYVIALGLLVLARHRRNIEAGWRRRRAFPRP